MLEHRPPSGCRTIVLRTLRACRLQAGVTAGSWTTALCRVRTKTHRRRAKAGHDLLLEVTAWQATLDVGEDAAATSIVLGADSTSLRVREGTGGMTGARRRRQGEHRADDRRRRPACGRHRVPLDRGAGRRGGDRLTVQGELTIVGATHPLSFELTVGSRAALSGSAAVHADRLGHQAVLDAVRRAQGRRRRRGPLRRLAWISRGRRPVRRDRPRRPAAARRCRARRARSPRPFAPGRSHPRPTRRCPSSAPPAAARARRPASSCAFARILPPPTDDAAGGAGGRARVVAVTHAEAVGVGGDDLDVERRHAELVGDELAYCASLPSDSVVRLSTILPVGCTRRKTAR